MLEFIDHAVGTEIMLDGVPKKWTRNADGGWDESSTAKPTPKRGLLARLFDSRSEWLTTNAPNRNAPAILRERPNLCARVADRAENEFNIAGGNPVMLGVRGLKLVSSRLKGI